MVQSVYSANASLAPAAAATPTGRARELQSFRGLILGIAFSAMLWAPIGMIAVRYL